MFKKTLLAVSLAATSLISTSAYAIENVDLLIKNATVLTMDQDKTVFDNGLVAVKGNKIYAVTDGSNISEYKAIKTIDADGDIVMPGLINAHTHASMTVFRSMADDVPDRLHRYIFPLEKKLVSRDMVRIGAQLGNVEMLKGGVTTYADM
ncbi:amidohydrolase family protein, partial [Photobacterium carnosum]